MRDIKLTHFDKLNLYCLADSKLIHSKYNLNVKEITLTPITNIFS